MIVQSEINKNIYSLFFVQKSIIEKERMYKTAVEDKLLTMKNDMLAKIKS
jgi:hypothetical protein